MAASAVNFGTGSGGLNGLPAAGPAAAAPDIRAAFLRPDQRPPGRTAAAAAVRGATAKKKWTFYSVWPALAAAVAAAASLAEW